jgi:hypothetical protein
MSKFKDGRVPIMLDKERHMLFSLNVMDEMEDRLGGYDKLDEALTGKKAIKNLKWLLTALVNEGSGEGEEPLTEQQIGKMIHVGNMPSLVKLVTEAFAAGTSGDGPPPGAGSGEGEDAEGDGEKN